MKGTIMFWNPSRQYGFIRVTNSDGRGNFLEQYFFHITNLKGFKETDVVLGRDVVFELGQPIAIGKKPQAINVCFVSPVKVGATLEPNNASQSEVRR